jgi:hypothetical protein
VKNGCQTEGRKEDCKKREKEEAEWRRVTMRCLMVSGESKENTMMLIKQRLQQLRHHTCSYCSWSLWQHIEVKNQVIPEAADFLKNEWEKSLLWWSTDGLPRMLLGRGPKPMTQILDEFDEKDINKKKTLYHFIFIALLLFLKYFLFGFKIYFKCIIIIFSI